MKKTHKKRAYKTPTDGKTYKENFLEIIKKANRPLMQKEIVDIYAEARNHGLSDDNEAYVTRGAIQSGASHYLPELVNERKVMLIDRKYVLFTRDIERSEQRKQIIKQVDFDCSKPFKASECVFAIKIKDGGIKAAANMFEEYLKEDCYDVVPVRGMILIMFECGEKKRSKHWADICAIIKGEDVSIDNPVET